MIGKQLWLVIASAIPLLTSAYNNLGQISSRTTCLAPLITRSMYKSLALHQTKAKSSTSKGNKKGQRKESPELLRVLEKYEPVIGIEVHCQLLCDTKAYCSCSTKYNPNIPNTNICPICMGEPGSLPTPNLKVLEYATKASTALNCHISDIIKFDRKNYFYPDTPKNYQITQYDYPIGSQGYIELPSGKRVGITRLHMEEDSAKMVHQGSASLAGSTHSLVDFNRAGVPLAEIVSEPDMRTPEEGADYGRELQKILRFIGVSDGNMADGSLRLDVNVSLRPKGSLSLNTKVEVKNINSFRFVADAIEYEIIRQAEMYEREEKILGETRQWDEREQKTKFMRSKEGAADYRFFPEPDIPPMSLSLSLKNKWQSELGELPSSMRKRYQEEYKLDAETARVLTDDLQVAAYLDETVREGAEAGEAVKWILGDMAGLLKAEEKEREKVNKKDKITPHHLLVLQILH